MKKYEFKGRNKGRIDAALDFPKFVLDKKGQKARVALFSIGDVDGKKAIVDPQPEGGYFFDLFNPLADQTYAGSYECLASEDAKEADEFEPGACPHCEFVVNGVGAAAQGLQVIGARRRKFVMPIVVYRTNLSGALMEPFSVDIKAWKFTDRYFNIITDEHEKWNLLEHDLTLTCDTPQFHTYTISVEPDCAYQADNDRLVRAMQTYASAIKMVPKGLIRQAGASLSPDDLRARVQRVLDQVEASLPGAGGGYRSVSSPTEAATLEEVLSSQDTADEDTEPFSDKHRTVDFDSFFTEEDE